MSTPAPSADEYRRALAGLVRRYLTLALREDIVRGNIAGQQDQLLELQAFCSVGANETELAFLLPSLRGCVRQLCEERDALRPVAGYRNVAAYDRAVGEHRRATLEWLKRRCAEKEESVEMHRDTFVRRLEEVHVARVAADRLDLSGCASGKETAALRAHMHRLYEQLFMLRSNRTQAFAREVTDAAHVETPPAPGGRPTTK